MTRLKMGVTLKSNARLVAGTTDLKDVFEERGNDDAYDCPWVRKGTFQPTGGVSGFGFLERKLIPEARRARFRDDLGQGIFNAIDGFFELFFVYSCGIYITLKAAFHWGEFPLRTKVVKK